MLSVSVTVKSGRVTVKVVSSSTLKADCPVMTGAVPPDVTPLTVKVPLLTAKKILSAHLTCSLAAALFTEGTSMAWVPSLGVPLKTVCEKVAPLE